MFNFIECYLRSLFLQDTPCSPHGCVNGACKYNSSVVNNRVYYFQYCQCNPGYYGDICQHRSVCDSNPCLNGGSCMNQNTGGSFSTDYYKCQCVNNYYGIKCENGKMSMNYVVLCQQLNRLMS